MIYAYISADGKRKPIESDRPLPLERLQALVGGLIEFVAMPDGTELCVNEEGRVRDLPRNARYPAVRGDVVVGRRVYTQDLSEVEFVGLI